MRKKIVCLFLGLVMMLSQTMTVLATTEDQLRQEKNQAESQLSETNSVINSLSERQTQIQSEINAMDADMVDLMIQIDAAKTDIANTETEIANTENDITNKKAEIEQTKKDLQDAEDDRDRQYEDMKKRIQYIYENGGDAAWIKMIFEAEDFSKVLNRADYAQSLHDYDRDQLEQYVAVVNQVTELKKNLEAQKAELEAQKAELETQKASLESQKADLEGQQADLQARIDEKQAASSDYASQIATARQQAAEISNLIAQQEAELNRLAEERRRAEEEAARQAAAEEARRQAAAEEAQRQQQSSNDESSTDSESDYDSGNVSENTSDSGTDDNDDTGSDSDTDSSSSDNDESSGGSSSDSGSSSSSDDSGTSGGSYEEEPSYSQGGSSGSAIVAYADQFVGNPYVWGGNSLTNGIDCSHFVWQVLKNCGVYSGGYTTSGGWRSLGQPVASLSEARAGDVICYSGHVAIYDGYGGIVEAKGSQWGITHDRSADCKTILAIRRFT